MFYYLVIFLNIYNLCIYVIWCIVLTRGVVMKEKMMKMKQKWLDAFDTIIVSLFLFLSIYYMFGLVHVILTSFLTLLFRIKHTSDFHIRDLVEIYVLMIVLCFLSFLASHNVWLCGLLNFVVPFFIVYMLTDKFTPKAYFVYMMEFVFLQLIPISFSVFIVREIALIYGLFVVTISLYLYQWRMKRTRNFHTAKHGMFTLSIMIDRMMNNQSIQVQKDELIGMMYHMNRVIYASRNLSYLVDGYGKINYLFMLAYQRFLYYVNHIENEAIDLRDKEYYMMLKELMIDLSENIGRNHQKVIRHIQEFDEHYALIDSSKQEAMSQIIHLLKYTFSELEKTSIHRSQKNWHIPHKVFSIEKMKHFMKLDLFQLRFALRLSSILCLTFLFCKITNYNHSYWLPMSAFLMLMPYSEESLMKITNRILGTICGVFLMFFISRFIHTTSDYIGVVLIMTCFMYYVPVTSWTMPMYTTCYGLSLAMFSLDVKEAIILRVGYVLLGALLTFLTNRFLLPNTAKREFERNIYELFSIDYALVEELEKLMSKQGDMNNFRNLIIHSRLLSQEIKTYIQNMNHSQDFYSQIIPLHQKLMYEIEQLHSYMRHSDYLKENMILKEVFKNMKDSICRIRRSYTQNELNSFMKTSKEFESYGELNKHMYFNTLVFNCMETLRDLENMKLEKC